MPDDGTQKAAYVPDAASDRADLAADRRRETRPSCNEELSLRRGWGDATEGGFWTGVPWERLVDFVVGARL